MPFSSTCLPMPSTRSSTRACSSHSTGRTCPRQTARALTLALAASLSLMAQAQAQTSSDALGANWVGLSLGGARADIDCATAAVCDRQALAGKLYLGSQLHPNFAVQGEWFQHQAASFQATTSAAENDYRSRGGAVYGLLTGQQGSAQFWGKLGVSVMQSQGSPGLAQAGQDASETHTRLAWGVGMGVDVNPQWNLRLEYDRLRGRLLGQTVDVDMVTVGAARRF